MSMTSCTHVRECVEEDVTKEATDGKRYGILHADIFRLLVDEGAHGA